MRILVTRPKPDGDALKRRLEDAGHAVILEPLIAVAYCAPAIRLDGIQAVIATSRNALRAVRDAPLVTQARSLPLFAVGPGTEACARDFGFENVVKGEGRAQDLPALVERTVEKRGGALLYLTGDRLAFDLEAALEASGFDVRREVVYRTVAAEAFTEPTLAAFAGRNLDAVALMSPRSAEVYAHLATSHGIEAQIQGMVHFCLSEAVAKSLFRLRLKSIAVAQSPNLDEMIALVNRTHQRFV